MENISVRKWTATTPREMFLFLSWPLDSIRDATKSPGGRWIEKILLPALERLGVIPEEPDDPIANPAQQPPVHPVLVPVIHAQVHILRYTWTDGTPTTLKCENRIIFINRDTKDALQLISTLV